MASFALKGVNYNGTGLLNASSITEFRGYSYLIGGDEGASTVANFMKHYNPILQGPSKGSHLAEICQGKWFAMMDLLVMSRYLHIDIP